MSFKAKHIKLTDSNNFKHASLQKRGNVRNGWDGKQIFTWPAPMFVPEHLQNSWPQAGKKKDSLFDRVGMVMHFTFMFHVFVSYSCFIFMVYSYCVFYSCQFFTLVQRSLLSTLVPLCHYVELLCVSGPWLHSVGCFGWWHHNYNPFWHVKHRDLAEVFCLFNTPWN